MDTLADIEKALHKVKLIRDLEHALTALRSGMTNNAMVTGIVATDASEAERSVHVEFTADESNSILSTALASLQVRHDALKTELGV